MNKKSLLYLVTLTLPSYLLLISCGGGSNSELPNTPEVDKTPPVVIAVTPGFEQADVNPNKFIRVTFSEGLSREITTEQVSIYPVIINSSNENLVTAKNVLTLGTNIIENDELIIELPANTLKFNTRYRVTIQNIKDVTGNPLLKLCQWDFITQNLDGLPSKVLDFNVSHVGKCSTSNSPNNPLQIQAFASNNHTNPPFNQPSIVLTWEAPVDGTIVEHYQIEKATLTDVNNEPVFVVLNRNFKELVFVDTTVTGGLLYRYRVTAHNKYGSSLANTSNIRLQELQSPLIKPKQVLVTNESLFPGINFGSSLTLNKDGSYLAVSSPNGSSTVELFNKVEGNWIQVKTLFSTADPNISNNGQFGFKVAFGTNDLLAIGQPRASSNVQTIGAVQLYKNTVDGWRYSETILSNSLVINNEFGKELAFSFDGNTLAVGEPARGSTSLGTVQLFTKTVQNTWEYSETLQPNTPSFDFGRDLAFSPDLKRTLLAVGGGEKVQLFIKTLSNWRYINEIIGNYGSMTFSTDGKLLVSKDTNTIPGSVSFFNESTTNTWDLKFKAYSNVLSNAGSFGDSIQFNQDGTILAISDSRGFDDRSINTGNVQLFKKTSVDTWSYIATLGSNVQRSGSSFGSSISFSSDGSTFIVGERSGSIDRNSIQSGVANIFELNNLIK